MTVADLIKILEKKDQKKEVEFIVCSGDEIVCMQLEKQTKNMVDVLKLFGNK